MEHTIADRFKKHIYTVADEPHFGENFDQEDVTHQDVY